MRNTTTTEKGAPKRNVRTARLAVGLAFAISVALVGASWPRAAETHNRLASNRLASNRLASNRLASNRLASNALTSTRLEADMATAELLSTADGRDVYYYLASCALPPDISIQAPVPGAPDTDSDAPYTCQNGVCVFPGSIGLAEDWVDHKLSSRDERWVSACVFARVNAHDTADGISLRGNHPALAVTRDEAELYTLQEGAFYGNLFVHEDDPIDWNACQGRDQASDESGGLALRDCAEPDPNDPTRTMCGFKFAGNCGNFTPQFPQPYACKTTFATGYGDCHDSAGDGQWPASRTYREVITTYTPQ